MSISTHINEYDDVDSFLGNAVINLSDSDAARKFLHERYPDYSDPEDDTAFDMDKSVNDPKFKIQVDDNSMDDFYEQNILTIHLPNKDDADDFAFIVGGEVIESEEPDDPSLKTFRITYRSEVFIKAKDEDEARQKFEELDLTSKEGNSKFVEECSFEEQ